MLNWSEYLFMVTSPSFAGPILGENKRIRDVGLDDGRFESWEVTCCFERENGGGPGIRTPGGLLTLGGFQDRCIRPLCQPTVFPLLPSDSGVHDTGIVCAVNALHKTPCKFEH